MDRRLEHDLAAIARRVKRGETVAAIARDLGCNAQTLRARMRNAGHIPRARPRKHGVTAAQRAYLDAFEHAMHKPDSERSDRMRHFLSTVAARATGP